MFVEDCTLMAEKRYCDHVQYFYSPSDTYTLLMSSYLENSKDWCLCYKGTSASPRFSVDIERFEVVFA